MAFIDYSQMLGVTDDWSDEKLDATIQDYKTAFKKASEENVAAHKRFAFYSRNVEGLERMKGYRDAKKLEKEFMLKKEHLQLLARMEFKNYEYSDSVFLGVEGKKPFGNSNLETDIANILELEINEDGEFDKKTQKEVDKLLAELPLAVNFLIKTALENFKKE